MSVTESWSAEQLETTDCMWHYLIRRGSGLSLCFFFSFFKGRWALGRLGSVAPPIPESSSSEVHSGESEPF